MRSFVLALSALLASIGIAAAAGGVTIVTPGHETWGKSDMGARMAVLYGNPDKSGYYVVRMKTTANWKFPPHWHPGRENVTVISGTFYAGLGRKFDAAKLTAFRAGSFISIPAGTPHFAWTKAPAVVQISGTQPLSDVMVK